MIEVALFYKKHNFSCIPIKANQKVTPLSWKQYQVAPILEEQLIQLFKGHNGNIAVVLGAASGNLAALDCETKEVFEYLKSSFQKEHGPTWTVRSHRGGHIYFRSLFPVKSRVYKEQCFELRGQKAYCVLPPSIHPEGIIYKEEVPLMDTPIPVIDSLSFLPLEFASLEIAESDAVRTEPGDLNLSEAELGDYWEQAKSFVRKILRRRERYKSKSEFDFAITSGLVNKEFPLEAIQYVFLKKIPYDFTHFGWLKTNRGLQVANKFIASECNRVDEKGHSPEFLENIKVSTCLYEHAKNIAWPGRTGDSDKRVLLEHIRTMCNSGQEVWWFPVRTGVLNASLGTKTVSKANNRLVKQKKLIKMTDFDTYKSGRGQAIEFSIHPDFLKDALDWCVQKGTITHINNNTNIVSNCGHLSTSEEAYGIFESKVLGKSAGEVFARLSSSPMTIKELIESTGKGKRTIRKALEKLELHSIILGIDGVYSLNPERNLEGISSLYGASEIHEKRERKVKAERDKFKNWRPTIQKKAL